MLLLTCMFISIGLVTAQTQKVTGVVISEEDGHPVVGASVLVKGTTLGTITDIDGNFTLPNVPTSAKHLVVSYIGMLTQEVAIKPSMKIYLKSDAELLDEVIVTAYGTSTKSAFTGSATVVSAETIERIQSSDALNALSGRVSGVQLTNTSGQPGASAPTIRIRGIGSINAGNSPLVILDGTPYDGDMNNINSADIESMTVLKDAASNALYGARGANGVIMITTKKGKTGEARVTVDAKWGGNTRSTRDYNYIKSPAQYYEMYYTALNNYYLNNGYSSGDAWTMANANITSSGSMGLGYNVYSLPEGESLIGLNGKLNPNATMGNKVSYNGEEYYLQADNWLDNAYKHGLRQEYNVSISNANDKASFYSSFSYLKNEGITKNSGFDRYTGRLKADYQVKPWLKVGANMSYAHFYINQMSNDGTSNSSGNIFAAATQIAPIYPLFMRDGNGNVIVDGNGVTRYDYGDGDNAGLTRPTYTNSNAISQSLLNKYQSEGNAFAATGYAEIRFLEYFKIVSNNSVTVDETRSTSMSNPFYGSSAVSNGSVSKSHNRTWFYNFQQLLTYSQSFGLNNFDVMLGHESFMNKNYYLSGSKTNMFDPANTELAGSVNEVSQNSYTSMYNTEGYFGRLQYDYDSKYFLSASYRRDASSRFHKDHRWGNFWSAGVAWNITNEEWFEADYFNLLKLKASYGTQGNDNIGNYRYTNTYEIINSSGNPATVPLTMGNPKITWETNRNFNIGFDFDMFASRFGGSVEFFNRKTTDMLFSFPLAPSFGYSSYYANIGDMRNMGLELEFNGTPIRNNNLTWDLRMNMTFYKNKIVKLPEERKTLVTPEGVEGFSSDNHFYGEGQPMYTFYMHKYAGVNENGEALYYTEKTAKDESGNDYTYTDTTTNGSDATQYLCGTALPKVYGGFGTTLNYKGFDFTIDFNYQLGGKVYDSDYARLMTPPTSQSRGSTFHADLLKAWSPTNTSSSIPRMQYGDQYSTSTSDRFLVSASYLSIQNINAGYTLPARICRAAFIEKARFYVACDNVFLWSKRQGMDPRQSIAGSTTGSYYAPIRTISGGVTLTF